MGNLMGERWHEFQKPLSFNLNLTICALLCEEYRDVFQGWKLGMMSGQQFG